MNIVLQMSGIMLAWMTTKSAPFGNLIAKNDICGLDHLFFRTLWQSLALFCACATSVLLGICLISRFMPNLGHRFVQWPVFLLLLLTALSSHVVQCEALYLRAHKCEPFLIQSIVVALCTATSVLLVAGPLGTIGVSGAYFLVLGVGGVISATLIFQRKRKQWAAEAYT